MEIKQAYEVYSLVGGGYGKRHLHGYAWTRLGAQSLAVAAVGQGRYHIGMVHLIKVGSRWHRIHVIPVESIEGDVVEAENSRIIEDENPLRFLPAINFQIDGCPPRRVNLDLEKAIDTLVGHDPDSECRLYTLRTGGKLPLIFKVRELKLSEHTQRRVVEWLNHEINFRISQGIK